VEFFVTRPARFGNFYSGTFIDLREDEMSNLNEIAHRHGRDRWKDALFIAAALLLTAISIGSVTSKAQGSVQQAKWEVSMTETPELLR
jgi:hypothetical protein